MKCPKCSYVSFEYLNSCKKCGIELSSHKAAHSIDFPQYSDLGILAMIQAEEPAAVAIEDAVAVADDEGEVSDIGIGAEEETAEEVSDDGLDLSSLGGPVEETTVSADMADMGDSEVELELPSEDIGEIEGPDDSSGIDWSGVGDSPEETASISLEDTGQETTTEISLEPEQPVEEEVAVDDGEGIALDLGEIEPVEAESVEPGTGEEAAEPESAEEETPSTQELDSTDEIEALDLGDMEDIDLNIDEGEQPAAEQEPSEDDISLDDLELDLNLDDDELLGGDSGADEPEGDAEDGEIDLDDLDLDDLKLDE